MLELRVRLSAQVIEKRKKNNNMRITVYCAKKERQTNVNFKYIVIYYTEKKCVNKSPTVKF